MKEFDERQLQIRGKIFQHGYIVTAFLLIGNGLVNKLIGEWTEVYHQNMLILMLIITVLTVEFSLNGVYLAKNFRRVSIILVFGLGAGATIIGSCIHIIKDNERFIVDNKLTQAGSTFLMGVLLLINTIFIIVQVLKERKQEIDPERNSSGASNNRGNNGGNYAN